MMVVLVGSVSETAEEPSPPPFFPLGVHWSTDLGQPSVAAPGYDDHRAYVPLRDGSLVAIRLSDGTVAWSIQQPTQFPPAVGAGLVVIASGSRLVGRHSDTADDVWSTDVGSEVSAPLLMTAGWLIAALQNGDLVALRAVDGLEIWRTVIAGEISTRPSVGGHQLFASINDGRIVALDLATGERTWETLLNGSPQDILPLDDLFVGSTDNFFYRLSRTDGRMQWRWRTGGDIVGPPAVDERHVIFASLDNMLRALDRNSGAQRWRRPLTGRPTGGPQAVGPMVLISGVSPELRAFDMTSGRSAGTLQGPGELAAPPHIVRHPSPLAPGIIVVTGDGALVGLFEARGPLRLSLDFPPPPLLPGPDALRAQDVLSSLTPLAPEPAPAATQTGVPSTTSSGVVGPPDSTPPP